jgi:hypothetical protein
MSGYGEASVTRGLLMGCGVRKSTTALLVAVVVGGFSPAVTDSGARAATPVSCVDEVASEAEAVAIAVACGSRVEATSARSELVQVFAEPSGQLVLEAAAVPQRTRKVDGSWVNIDLGLSRGSDGLLRPAASTADVRFSGGGDGPLVTLMRGGQTLTVSWPASLPAPVLSGDSATYGEVLPGTDLVVRATRTGFAHVLVIKTPEAAANPALHEIHLDLGGDAQISQVPGGGLRATTGNSLLASASPVTMWDSSVAPARSASATAQALDAGSTPAGPGDAAQTAAVATEVTAGGDLLLRPDSQMLSSDQVTFPLFVDPPWNTGKTRWAYTTSSGLTNSDLASARVGKRPDTDELYRSFFEFPTTYLKYKHIESAYVQMKLDHSWSCVGTTTHMYASAAVSGTPRTKWGTKLITWLASADSHANEDSGCSDSPQSDMTVNFTGGNVTSLIQGMANKGQTNQTIGFCACNSAGDYEDAQDRWKRFLPDNAKLIVDVDAKPGKPTGPQVSGVACTSSGISIGTLTPTLSASFPDGDGSQAIKGTWEWLEIPASGIWDDATPRKPAPAQTSVAANTRGTTVALSGLVTGKKYAYRVKGTDPAPYNQVSAWSDWCVFWPDTTVPPVTVATVTLPPGPGKPGTFRIDSTASDVVKFRYGWTEAVVSEVTPTTGSGGTGKTATVTITASKYGQNTLYVQAIDATTNKGYGSADFTVARPTPAVARWGLETYPGVDQSAALADQQPALAGNTPLTTSTMTWASDARLIGGQTSAFNGTATQASAGAAVVDSTKSFSVAAWVRMGNPGDSLPTANKAVVGLDGDRVDSFVLGYRGATQQWAFWLHAQDVDSTPTAALALASVAPVAGRWTHLAGVYDAADKQIRLYVDGQLAGTTAVSQPPAWSGRALSVGREKWNGSLIGFWSGGVADVQVFDRVIVDQDFTGQLASDPESGGFDEPGILNPIEVDRWDFDLAGPCYSPAIEDTCGVPDSSEWLRRLATTAGTWVDTGHHSVGLQTDGSHWVDDPTDPLYGTATREYGLSQRNTAPSGQPAQWADTPVLRTDGSFTVSVWVRPEEFLGGAVTVVGQKGVEQSAFNLGARRYTVNGVNQYRWAMMMKSKDDDVGETNVEASMTSVLSDDDTSGWTHLVGVFDARAKQIRLYVNGALAATAARSDAWQADGPLTVGASWWSPDGGATQWTDFWHGGIDDLRVYQGAMTDAQVVTLFDTQSATADQ